MTDPIRPLLRQLRPNGLVEVANLGLHRPGLIPLWFGESDLVTPEFIRNAAIAALTEGKTFYTWARGIRSSGKRSPTSINGLSALRSIRNASRYRARQCWRS